MVCNFQTQERPALFRDKPTLGFLPENVCSTFLSLNQELISKYDH